MRFIIWILSIISILFWYILLNIYTLNPSIEILIAWIIFLAIFIYLFISLKNIIAFLLSLFLIIWYTYYYKQVDFQFKDYDYQFLEEQNTRIEETNYQVNSNVKKCIKTWCDLKIAFRQDIQTINNLIENPQKQTNILNLWSVIKSIDENYIILRKNNIDNFDVDFNKEKFTKKIITINYANNYWVPNPIYKSIYYKELEFKNYLKNVYYFYYDNIINENNNDILEFENKHLKTNIYSYKTLLDKEILYKYISTNIIMKSYLNNINNIKATIEKLKSGFNN
jgi:hypothetical protein